MPIRHLGIADHNDATIGVGKRVKAGINGLVETAAGGQMDIQVKRLSVRTLHSPGDIVTTSGDDAYVNALIRGEFRNGRRRNITVERRNHFILRR